MFAKFAVQPDGFVYARWNQWASDIDDLSSSFFSELERTDGVHPPP